MSRSTQREWNEHTRVKLPAVVHLEKLGWHWTSRDELQCSLHPMRISLPVLSQSLSHINGRQVTIAEAKKIADAIERCCNRTDLGRAFYNWLIDPTQAPKGLFDDDEEPLRLVDFDSIENNDYRVTTEVSFGNTAIKGEFFRVDVCLFMNGIPFPGFHECKPPDNSGGIQEEFIRMKKRQANPSNTKFFNMFAVMSFSNNMPYETGYVPMDERKAGSFYTTNNGTKTSYSLWREKETDTLPIVDIPVDRIKTIITDNGYPSELYDRPEFQRNIAVDTPQNRHLASLFSHERFMFLLRNCILYKQEGADIEKHIARYPQYYAVKHLLDDAERDGHGGVIFHGQGTGKTETAGMGANVLARHYGDSGVLTRQFFLTDRLALATQAQTEFQAMGFDVVRINTKKQFEEILTKPLGNDGDRYQHLGKRRIYVVNVQKFADSLNDLTVSNPYGVTVKNIFYIDECHRSYNTHGEYYMTMRGIDRDASYVALTGTPVLSEKERTTAKFGGYLDACFYGESIENGFTVPIMKAKIETRAAVKIRENLQRAKQSPSVKDAYESEDFVTSCAVYVDADFAEFRRERQDESVGAMLVAASKKQAHMLYDWLNKNSDLRVAVVTSEEPDTRNRDNEKAFKKGDIDIIIVYQMLQEGFNVPRLKRMYLLRHPKDKGLLQLIGRLNRPYRNPTTGRWYRYGYLVDFADIEKDYEETIQTYLEELRKYDGLTPEEFEAAAGGLLVDPEELEDEINKAIEVLDDEFNLQMTKDRETLQKRVSRYDLDSLREIRGHVSVILDAYQELKLAGDTDRLVNFDADKMKSLAGIVQKRINFKNFETNPGEALSILDDDEIMEIVYDFEVQSEGVLNTTDLEDIQDELVDKQQKKELGEELSSLRDEIDDMIDLSGTYRQTLDEMLADLFKKMRIGNYRYIKDKLEAMRQELHQNKQDDQRKLDRFGGNVGFARTRFEIAQGHTGLNWSPEVADAVMDVAYKVYTDIENLTLISSYDDFERAMTGAMTKFMRSANITVDGTRLYRASGFGASKDDILRLLYANLHE